MKRLLHLRFLVCGLFFAIFLTVAFLAGPRWAAPFGAELAWAAPVQVPPNQTIPFDTSLLVPYVVVPPPGSCTFFDVRCNLTNTTDAIEGEFAWSPNGERIAYVSYSQEKYGLYLMSGEGGHVTQVIGDWPDNASAYFSDVSWSPNGGKIAFVVTVYIGSPPNTGNNESRVYVMDADGSDMTLLQQDVLSYEAWHTYDWSPDGAKVVIGGLRSALTVIGVDGRGAVSLPSPPEVLYAWQPKWSPAGNQIAFTANPWNGLYLVDADGTNLHQGETDGLIIFDVVWSPDGSKLAYRLGLYEPEFITESLYVIEAKGSNALLMGTMLGWPPGVWTLDSLSLITLGHEIPGISDIYKVNADGSALRNMTNDTALESDLLLSPDGSRLLYLNWPNGTLTNDYDFHVMAIDGSQTSEFVGPQDAETGSIVNLTWRPDGKAISYSYQGDIFLLRVNAEAEAMEGNLGWN